MIMSIESWSLFIISASLLSLSPGPDLIFILSKTLAHGRKIGITAAAGVCSGAFVHVLAAALGLSAILATSATAFMLVKYVGAAYLIYLGIRALFAKESALAFNDDTTKKVCAVSVFRQGMLIDILNPKVAIFFMAFLPQFITPGSGYVVEQTVFLGFLVVLIGFAIEAVYVLAAAPLGNYLKTHPKFALWLDRAFGGLLVGLGARLATVSRT